MQGSARLCKRNDGHNRRFSVLQRIAKELEQPAPASPVSPTGHTWRRTSTDSQGSVELKDHFRHAVGLRGSPGDHQIQITIE